MSTAAALVALAYGLALIALGRDAAKARKHRLPVLGGYGLGGLAALGGLTMALGAEAGRGMALLAAVVALLVFGWILSQQILNDRPDRRALGIFLASLVVAVVLVRGA